MTVKSYGDSDVFVLIFNCPAFDDTTDPIYPTGNATVTWKPRSDMPFEVIGLDVIGACTAAGTAATVQVNVYNGPASGGAAAIAMTATTTATDDAADIDASSTTPAQPGTGKQFITSADGICLRATVAISTMSVSFLTIYVTCRFR